MFVCCDFCVLSGRSLCDGLITRPDESYRLWCVVVCDLETSKMRGHINCDWASNRRCIAGCISYMPLILTVKHDCWMSSDRLQCSGRVKKIHISAEALISKVQFIHSVRIVMIKPVFVERFLQYTCWMQHDDCVPNCFEVTVLWNVVQCSLIASVRISIWACCLDLAGNWLHTRRHFPTKRYLHRHHSGKFKPNAMMVCCLLFLCYDQNVCGVSDYCILSGAL
jgi:hypothetical protein